MKKIIFIVTFSSIFSLLGCKSEEEKFLENHKVIPYDTKEAELFINNSVIKPMEASKIQREFALKNNRHPEMHTFFIVDNYYVFTSYFLPRNLGIYSVNIMENGEHCTSTVYKSLFEAKLIKKLPFWVICTPKSFLKHLKRSKLRHTAGTKKGKLAEKTVLKDLS